jgi:hypothetical protein
MMRTFVALLALLLPAAGHAANAFDLHMAVQQACGCKVLSATVGDPSSRNTWSVIYDPSATAQQKTLGNAVLTTFVMTQPSVPQVVGAMNAKVALLRAGLLPSVQAWVNTQSAEQQLIWNTATDFRRDSALIAAGAAALGLTSAQLDQLFITAATVMP